MSLGVGICVCALLACGAPARRGSAMRCAVAVVFFGLHLSRRTRAQFRSKTACRTRWPNSAPGQRVISAVTIPDLRVNALAHMIDRVCMGRCYSYANYEPSTWQFRVRALGPNPLVTASYQDSWLMQTGGYVVKESDAPLYQVYVNRRGTMLIRSLEVGKPCGSTLLKALPDLFPNG